ncbi:hypothetical protein E1193_22590 [Micromonospora sp. KC606]|uniref:DUF3592 domain-containing protein n=1 Tax=Micromonospora sp. KC606 TaxID=2530379 RepID=UPI0010432DAD|nr:DUF3592 domain-containing protein [Micromonospora sp. KC606]TDC77335.1 hypothetical protein E1193_22590 [Micromonospora sp. KC606]
MEASASRQLTPARLAGLACAVVLVFAAGRLLIDGITLQDSAGEESAGSALRIVSGVLFAMTGLSWAGGLIYRGGTAGRLPFGLVIAVCLGFGLLGAYWANRSALLLIAIAVMLAIAALSVVTHERWRDRQLERERQVEAHAAALGARGQLSSGVIIGVEKTGWMHGDDPQLRLTARFTVDGGERTESAEAFYPQYDLPRTGDQVTVRYLPDDPSVIDIHEDRR